LQDKRRKKRKENGLLVLTGRERLFSGLECFQEHTYDFRVKLFSAACFHYLDRFLF